MDKWIKENKITTAIVIILSVAFGLGYFDKGELKTEESSRTYELNSDCSKKAIAFAKEKSDVIETWNVLQNVYNVDKKSCFGEFSYVNMNHGTTKEIYDLLLNKELALTTSLLGTEDQKTITFWKENYENKYEKIKVEIFTEPKNK